jgi:hypothetical protein
MREAAMLEYPIGDSNKSICQQSDVEAVLEGSLINPLFRDC